MSNYFKHIQMPNGDIIEVDTRDCANIDLSNLSDTGKEYIKKNVASFPLFYRIISDYVLTGVEAKGKLLQGSLVTNLYPDAVAHVKADWDNGTTQIFTLDDITFEYKVAQDKHLIVDIANKTQVDNLFTKTGIAEFYILDYANNQFYLPRNLWFDQYTNDPEQVNKYNEAGLPNIRAVLREVHCRGLDAEGAFKTEDEPYTFSGSGTGGVRQKVTLDASSINAIYKNDFNTIQPPSSNKLLYFVVGNTYVNQEDINIAQVESEISGLKADRLNIDLTNATQTTKETIVNYNGIDYDMGIKIETSQLFTPEKDGVIVSIAQASGTETGVYIYRGNSTAFENLIGAAFSSRSSATFGSSETRVTKGKEYNLVLYNPSNTTCKFYPCNGVKE